VSTEQDLDRATRYLEGCEKDIGANSKSVASRRQLEPPLLHIDLKLLEVFGAIPVEIDSPNH
jgi:hypothetical protein